MGKWGKVRLGDIATIVSGSTPKSNVSHYWNGEYNWVTPAEIDESSMYIYETARKITKEAVSDTNLKLLPVGTVLLSSRAPIGKVAIAGNDMYCNQGFKNLICGDRLYNQYLYWYLKSKTDYLNSLGRGATFKEISKAIVENIAIPLPPVEKQKQIAKHLFVTNELMNKYKKKIDLLNNLITAIFFDIVGEPFTNPKNLTSYKLSELCNITMGQSPPGETYNYAGIGIPLLNGPTEFGEQYPEEKQWTTAPTKICDAGDILICVRGATAGRLNVANKRYCIGRGLAAIKPNTPSLSKYLFIYLRAMYDYFQSTSDGSTFINISKDQLINLPVLVVDQKIQNRFAEIVTKIEQQKALVKKAIEETQTLFDSLMSKYFDD